MAERTNPYSGMTVSEIAAARAANKEAQAANRTTRMEQLRTERNAVALQKALDRAATDPKYNFTQRPEGMVNEEKGVIEYYGWNGGKGTGQWVKREAVLNDTNLARYGSRVPANTYAVKDIVSTPVPVKDITGETQTPGGFIVTKEGKVETVGNVDTSVLNIKSEYDTEKRKQMSVSRETDKLARAIDRAATNPLYNFMMRPEGKIDGNKIQFYGWIGGKETGQWVLYEALNTPYNRELYQTRVTPMEYYAPKNIRDVLIPKKNILGEPQGSNIVTK